MQTLEKMPGRGRPALSLLLGGALTASALPGPVIAEPAQYPLFMGADIAAPPLTMLVMGRDHTLYYEAYNDASDLNGDGVLDVGYKPDLVGADGEPVDYFGYFDSYLCYGYSDSDGRFYPTGTTDDKTCGGSAWSGDYLNYLTTARIDALRKVLYGGHRIVDQGSEADDCLPDDCLTVLERSYIPQDAHSWGKEYKSIDHDGYDIRDYTPLDLPAADTRHLFANTTLLKSGDKEPRLRILPNSQYRIWEWVAIERPVAGDKCLHGGSGPACETAGGDDWETVPDTVLTLTQTTWKTPGYTYPSTEAEYDDLVDTYATTENLCGSMEVSTINGEGNPFSGTNGCTNDDYLTIFAGEIEIAEAGTYTFAIDGDDAIDLHIDGELVEGWYGGHGRCNCNTHTGDIYLDEGTHSLRFRHQEASGDDNYYLRWERSNSASTMTDYFVRVEVCDKDYPDAVCKAYPAGTMKPTGVLQRYGESDEMLFGLLTGSYGENLEGGVLRKNIESFQNEIDTQTGQFSDIEGIVSTIDLLRIVDFRMNADYEYAGGWLVTNSMATGGNFPDWGNPIGEMVYETLRYFSGKEAPTSEFIPDLTDGYERVTLRDYSGSSTMDLPVADWRDPYYDYDDDGNKSEEPSEFYCSPGAQLIISDVNPSYDSDSVPGSYFESFAGDISGLDAQAEADAIWTAEHGGGSAQHFIGQSKDDDDGAPTAKTVDGLGSIRGLSPAEPTKQGSYYTAGIARHGFENDLRDDVEDIQDINTFSVALASPLPRIEIPVGGERVTLVPFAKSVGGSVSGQTISGDKEDFQPTNTIVDFFIEAFANTAEDGSDADEEINDGRPYIKFRINYEDVEQGADHDMDAIVIYELTVNGDETLTVDLTSEYAAGSIKHHLGYVISGTEDDGVYLEVRDEDTSSGSDPDYFLDTPAGLSPGACDAASPPSACDEPLPLFTIPPRTFTASAESEAATVLESPLWYAAKYGSEGNEDLAAGETSPNYFLVTNAGTLQEQLETAFESIILLGESTASAIAVDSVRIDTESVAFKASFESDDWSGTLIASPVEDDGTLGDARWSTDTVDWPEPHSRNIFTYDPGDADSDPAGIAFAFDSLTEAQQSALGADATEQANVLNWLRGDQSLEGPGDTDFRQREHLLGDIVNSNPHYDDATSTLYVGANDGMLHAFQADDTAFAGQERFAYVPNALFPTLANLTEQGYVHRYYVDGSPSVAEVGEDDTRRSILVGTLAAGGRAVFALDVTAPDSFAADDVLWEIGHEDADFAELGYMVGQMTPTPVVGVWNGNEVVVFGNGVDSETGATLFVVDVETGELVDKLTVSTASDNGLAGATLVLDPDGEIAAAYAGDLNGNLWKFDFTGSTLELAVGGDPLFVAHYPAAEGDEDEDDDGWIPQPITAPVNVAKHPDGGNIVVFGTGQYLRTTDPADLAVQTAYGVWDTARLQGTEGGYAWSGGTSTARGELLQQEFFYEDVIGERKWRIVSDYTLDWNSKRGWFVDLVSPVDGEQGERINYQPSVIPGTGEVMFTSIVPTQADDPCMAGTAYRWIFVLDSQSGGISDWTRFDTNEDGVFDEQDVKRIVEDGETDPELVPYIGFTTDFGGSATPAGQDADVVILDERLMPGGPPRQSWRQLR